MAETEQAQEQEQQSSEQIEAQKVDLTEAEDVGAVPDEANLDVLLDISMPITINIGQIEVPFRRLLQLGPGSVLQLDKTIGEPAEILVQGIKFATGDIVVVDGNYAVRMKEVLGMDPVGQETQE